MGHQKSQFKIIFSHTSDYIPKSLQYGCGTVPHKNHIFKYLFDKIQLPKIQTFIRFRFYSIFRIKIKCYFLSFYYLTITLHSVPDFVRPKTNAHVLRLSKFHKRSVLACMVWTLNYYRLTTFLKTCT